jgi:histidine kinase
LSAVIVMSLIVSRGIVEPLQAMSRISKNMAQGFYRERIVVTSEGELAELSRSVNQLAEALEQTEQQRMTLLADVIHELRTPLTTIEGYMEGLVDGVVKPNDQTFNLVMREAVRMKRLIEDLELLSRAEAGQIQVRARPIDIRTILEKLAIQFQPQFAAREIKLTMILPAGKLPAVWADPDRVEQVVINLLTNALRYTPGGGNVTLQAWGGERYVIVSVKDSGIGISKEHLPHIFERFYRVDKSRSRSSGGSGIGLTVARHLVYVQGGQLYAESEGAGRGSRFWFTLPWASEPATESLGMDMDEVDHASGQIVVVA